MLGALGPHRRSSDSPQRLHGPFLYLIGQSRELIGKRLAAARSRRIGAKHIANSSSMSSTSS